MKIESIYNYNVVRLSDGTLCEFTGQTDILPVNAELIIS